MFEKEQGCGSGWEDVAFASSHTQSEMMSGDDCTKWKQTVRDKTRDYDSYKVQLINSNSLCSV